MVSMTPETQVSEPRMSSVVPAEVTVKDKDHGLTNLDLVMKLHYIRGIYLFPAEAVQGLTTYDLKKAMFPLLAVYNTASGRIRRSDSGKPFIKCNDGGVRILEAYCEKTMEEWSKLKDCHDSIDNTIVHEQVLGPDLGFSPLVFVQFTWFKCGGMAVALSWAHVLGDFFSASNFINTWARIVRGHLPSKLHHLPQPMESENPPSNSSTPLSLKRVDPVGDYWLTTNSCKMETHSFHFTAKHLDNVFSKLDHLNQPDKVSNFSVLSALIWKSLSKIRGDSGSRIVTIVSRTSLPSQAEFPSNKVVLSIVEADFSVAKSDVSELAALITDRKEDENNLIKKTIESENGESDYIAYGANLTFVNLEEANIYGLELNGHKPVYANYNIKGVGDAGAALVLPGPSNGAEGPDGRLMTLILPENELAVIKQELAKDWSL